MNPMTNATCNYTLLDANTVLFHIDLKMHVHLRNPDLVAECMDDFMIKYPSVYGWSAEASGDDLNIIVTGNVNLHAGN